MGKETVGAQSLVGRALGCGVWSGLDCAEVGTVGTGTLQDPVLDPVLHNCGGAGHLYGVRRQVDRQSPIVSN